MFTTIETLKKNYQNYLQAQNSKINPYAPNSFYDIDAGAMGSFTLDLYMNLLNVQNSIYSQNLVGTNVDKKLFSLGLPARGGLTFGTINVTVNAITPSPGTISANTIFTDSITSNQYQNLIEIDDVTSGSIFTLYSVTAGNNYIEPIGNSLSTADGVTVTVNFSTNGQLLESDQSCVNRILQAQREPTAGARATDYEIYALESDSNITDSIVILSFVTINNVNILGVFVLIGTFITEYQLNQGLLSGTTFVQYSREADSAIITTANNYIQGQKLVGLNPIVGTSTTTLVFSSTNLLNIQVALVSGYSLSTLISIDSQDATNNPIVIQLTVEQLIQREARRAICNQPYGGTKIGSNLYITMDSIIYALNAQLSSSSGQIAQLLTNIIISNADQPGGTQTSNGISYIFDIEDYDSINITLQGS